MSKLSIEQKRSAIAVAIDSKIKPVGALGEIEKLAAKLALIQSQQTVVQKIQIEKPTLLLFAADHGVAQHGVSIAPSDVTTLMVTQFLSGGAAINSFVRVNEISLHVIDAGMKSPVPDSFNENKNLFVQRVGNGTHDFSLEPAMTSTQLEQALNYGGRSFQHAVDNGCNLVLLGEMGIGNTTSAAAILSAISGLAPQQSVGKGTGVSGKQVQLKASLIELALARFDERDAKTVLQQLGGFEIAQMVGVILAAEKAQVPVVIDGFIVSSAALIASKLVPSCLDIMIFAHCSDEKAHQYMLDEMSVKPLMSLGLRLGEGTGAALAVPMIRIAADFYNNMRTFADLGIELP